MLWTNSKARGDYVKEGILECCRSPSVNNVYIASAFFTDIDTIKGILAEGCHIKLIVRLGYPTTPMALKEFLNNDHVEIRYYDAHSFHPKLYIFGTSVAMVGSANLTDRAVRSNQEVVVSIGNEDPRFETLNVLFNDYWEQSSVLTKEILDFYTASHAKHVNNMNGEHVITQELQAKFGKTVFQDIFLDDRPRSKKIVSLNEYQKKYQEWVTAYNEIKSIYNSVGKRKNDNSSIPIRIEIDAFISNVRRHYASTDKWETSNINSPEERESVLQSHIHEWLEADTPYYTVDICTKKYPLISDVFSSQEAIEKADYRELIKALEVLHSFSERLRFFPGGLDTLFKQFQNNNDLQRVRDSLSYLIFGEGDAISRMANLIYNSDYKLHDFGLSNVQELIGWVNNDELPVVNSRTTKIFRFYGFEVQQI